MVNLIKCASCDEGMYLYPVVDVRYKNSYYYPYAESYTTCIVDCNEYDRNFVNNPILMRCEYLGMYCLYGNYTHGCLATLTAYDGDSKNYCIFNSYR